MASSLYGSTRASDLGKGNRYVWLAFTLPIFGSFPGCAALGR